MVKVIRPSWKEIERLCKKLSKKIKKEFSPDVIIGITRGGLVPLRLFSDYLDNHNITTIRIEYYTGIGKTRKKPKITQSLNVNIKGKKVLLVDDVSDKGQSLKEGVKYLRKFKPSRLKVVTLHYKPGSVYKPDYFEGKTSAWIVYPWEKKEFEKLRMKK